MSNGYGIFGTPYPAGQAADGAGDALQDLLGALVPATPQQRMQGPMEFPTRSSPTNAEGHPSAAINPAARAKLATEAALKREQQDREMIQHFAMQEAKHARERSALEAQDALVRAQAEQEKRKLKALDEVAKIGEKAKQDTEKQQATEQKGSIGRQRLATQSAKAQQGAAQVAAERAAAPANVVAEATAGVENRGNLAAPGASARGTYDVDGAGAAGAMQGALGAVAGDPTLQQAAAGNSVNVGGQQFTAPPTIQSREFSYAPQMLRTSTGFMGVGMPSYSTRSTDNVLSAGDVAMLRQRQVESMATRVDELRQDMPDAPIEQVVGYARALESGDPLQMAEAAKGLPEGLRTRAAKMAINTAFVNNQEAMLRLNYAKMQIQQMGAAAQMNPLSLMGLAAGGPGGAFGGGLGLPGLGGRTGSGYKSEFGSLGNLANTAFGKGDLDTPNPAALTGMQQYYLQQTNGQVMAMIPANGDYEKGFEFRDTGEFVDLFNAAVQAPTAEAQAQYIAKLQATGMFTPVKGADGKVRFVVDAASPNAFNAHAILNYVNNVSQLKQAALEAGQVWEGPIRRNAMAVEMVRNPGTPAAGYQTNNERLQARLAQLRDLQRRVGAGTTPKLDEDIYQIERTLRGGGRLEAAVKAIKGLGGSGAAAQEELRKLGY